MSGSYWPDGADEKPQKCPKPHACGPVVERAGRSLLAVRRQVPFAEAACRRSRSPSGPGATGRSSRDAAGVTRERPRELRASTPCRRGAGCDPSASPPGSVSTARSRGSGCTLAPAPRPGHRWSRDRSAERVRADRSPASSIRIEEHVRRTFGRLRPGTIVQSATDSSSVRPAVPPKSGRGSAACAVGDELAHRLGEPSLSALMPFLSVCTTDFASGAGQRLLDREPLSFVEGGDDARGAGRQLLADLLHPASRPYGRRTCRPARRRRRPRRSTRVMAARRARRGRRRRRPTRPLAAAVIGGLCTPIDPSSACVIRIAASIAIFLPRRVWRARRTPLRGDSRVRAHEDIGPCLSHHVLLQQSVTSQFGSRRAAGSCHNPVCTSIRPELAAACKAS